MASPAIFAATRAIASPAAPLPASQRDLERPARPVVGQEPLNVVVEHGSVLGAAGAVAKRPPRRSRPAAGCRRRRTAPCPIIILNPLYSGGLCEPETHEPRVGAEMVDGEIEHRRRAEPDAERHRTPPRRCPRRRLSRSRARRRARRDRRRRACRPSPPPSSRRRGRSRTRRRRPASCRRCRGCRTRAGSWGRAGAALRVLAPCQDAASARAPAGSAGGRPIET